MAPPLGAAAAALAFAGAADALVTKGSSTLSDSQGGGHGCVGMKVVTMSLATLQAEGATGTLAPSELG